MLFLSLCGRHRIGNFGSFNSFWSDFKSPGDHERDRKSGYDDRNDQAHNPIRNFEEWKNLRRNLNEQPTDNGVSDRDFVNVAPLQLGEEVAPIHFAVCRPTTLVGSIPILRSSSGNLLSE